MYCVVHKEIAGFHLTHAHAFSLLGQNLCLIPFFRNFIAHTVTLVVAGTRFILFDSSNNSTFSLLHQWPNNQVTTNSTIFLTCDSICDMRTNSRLDQTNLLIVTREKEKWYFEARKNTDVLLGGQADKMSLRWVCICFSKATLWAFLLSSYFGTWDNAVGSLFSFLSPLWDLQYTDSMASVLLDYITKKQNNVCFVVWRDSS